VSTSSSHYSADATTLFREQFTPNELTLLDTLAQCGAYIIRFITLTSEAPDTGTPAMLVSLLRSTTSNENIYVWMRPYSLMSMRLSGHHTTSPFAPDGTCRARRMSNYPHQSVSRRGSSRIHRISIFSLIVIASHGGSACSPHGNIDAPCTTRSRCPPFGFTTSPTDVNAQPTSCERQGATFKHPISVSHGISRADVVAPLLAADLPRGSVSWFGMIM
jgi:hypothetical protein